MMRLLLALTLSMALACGMGAADLSTSTTSPVVGGASVATPVSSSIPSQCAPLLQQYEFEMAAAVRCSAAGGDSCGGREPALAYRQDANGQTAISGLCSCPTAVNPGSTTAMDAIVASLAERGCLVGSCPCPPNGPAGTCDTAGVEPGLCR